MLERSKVLALLLIIAAIGFFAFKQINALQAQAYTDEGDSLMSYFDSVDQDDNITSGEAFKRFKIAKAASEKYNAAYEIFGVDAGSSRLDAEYKTEWYRSIYNHKRIAERIQQSLEAYDDTNDALTKWADKVIKRKNLAVRKF